MVPSSIASGKRSKSATPATAPAENPRMRCSLSRNRSANEPPIKVATDAARAISRTFIYFKTASMAVLKFGNGYAPRMTCVPTRTAGVAFTPAFCASVLSASIIA